MDVSRAQVANTGDEVVLVDPGWPWTVRVLVGEVDGRPAITTLTVEARELEGGAVVGGGTYRLPITAGVLDQLPIRQLTHVAASALAGEGETHYRMLARSRPRGQRGWPADHFQRVARVGAWARATGRPGGAAGAVAEFWGVHLRTARRWLAQARAAAPAPR